VTQEGGCIVVCGGNHLPATLMLPIEGNTLQGERFRKQAEISKPFSKKLWSQLIKGKIYQQGRLLEKEGKNPETLNRLGDRVRSGDPDNLEAQASRNYWKPLFGKEFTRHREGKSPNNLLNYGYTVLRSMVARALCSTGLHPTLGVHHHNKYNAYALADDVMEPYRSIVDQTVLEHLKKEDVSKEINRESKTSLLGMFNRHLYMGGNKQVVQIAIQMTAESLSKSIMENEVKLKLPESLLLEEP
jgi:CRISPR-associated protein Cas1